MSEPCKYCKMEYKELPDLSYNKPRAFRGDAIPMSTMSDSELMIVLNNGNSGNVFYKNEEKGYYLHNEVEKDNYYNFSAKIHYCPWCGRRLNGDT